MENQNMMPQGQGNQIPPMGQPSSDNGEKSVGALIGSIIIVLILIVGGFYLWSTKATPTTEPLNQEIPAPENMPAAGVPEQASTETDPVVDQLGAVSASDDTISIENDLKTTNLDGFDAELQ